MTELEKEQRGRLIDEAMSWIGTPYHHNARLKHIGVDCAWFLADVPANIGLIPRLEIEHYPPDWMQHQSDERYLRRVLVFCRRLPEGEEPQAGDVAMYKFGRCAAHGAFVVEWPRIIHALIGLGVTLGEAFSPQLANSFFGFYRYKGWE